MEFTDRNLNDIAPRFMSRLPVSRYDAAFQLMVAAQISAHDRSENFERANYAFYVFELVTDGSGTVRFDDRGFEAKAGDIYLLPAGRSHAIAGTPEHPWMKRYFCTHGRLIPALLDIYNLADIRHFPGAGLEPENAGIFTRLIEIFQRSAPEMNRDGALEVHRLIANLAGFGVTSARPMAVLEIKHYLDRHLYDKFSLELLARHIGLSGRRICGIFKAATGETPFEYHTARRVELATGLLRSSDLSVAEIAAKLNFRDPYYFSRLLKQRTGQSPRRLRKGAKAIS